jgi:hypothetical protein
MAGGVARQVEASLFTAPDADADADEGYVNMSG